MKKVRIFIAFAIVLLSGACTNLDETLYDRINADSYFQNEDEIKAGLTAVHYKLVQVHDWFLLWQLQEVSTDHAELPTRSNGGWYDGGIFIEETTRTWNANHNTVNSLYKNIYSAIAMSNSFIETIEVAQKKIDGLESVKAETRIIRAWCYTLLCDLFGNVPIVTVAKLDQQNLPTNSSRLEVFNFIERELLESVDLVPSVNAVNRADYYPRMTKEIVWAMLAKLYLNAEVYSGKARWQDCINASDKVINSGAFRLTPSIWDSFVPENENSPEIIFAIVQNNKDIVINQAGGNWADQLGLHPLLQFKYDLPFSPWGGPRVGNTHYESYDNDDFRKTLILSGKQYASNGDFLFEITPLKSITNAGQDEGYISIKYQPDPQQIGMSARNDQVLIRYADILLSKAEALFRLNNKGEATTLVNQVRARNFNPVKPLSNLTLDDILMERSHEFLWEHMYRTDLIRFGKFLSSTYDFKPNPTTELFRTIYPIPQSELQSNPNLKQNPGY